MSEIANTEQSGSQVAALADLILKADQEYGSTPISCGGPWNWSAMGRSEAVALAAAIVRDGYRK